MVRACLRELDPKGQTRRVLSYQNPVDLGASMFGTHLVRRPVHDHGKLVGTRLAVVKCPYGEPGVRLWVRETFANIDGKNWYRADPLVEDCIAKSMGGFKWTPAIHMPRVACRLVLEVTGVRVERLQDISEADAIAEGIITPAYPPGVGPPKYALAYSHLWDSLNAKRGFGWSTNPWVWVVEFRRAERLKAAA